MRIIKQVINFLIIFLRIKFLIFNLNIIWAKLSIVVLIREVKKVLWRFNSNNLLLISKVKSIRIILFFIFSINVKEESGNLNFKIN